VVDDDGLPSPPGQAGELLVKSDTDGAFASGYWASPDETEKSWQGEWFHTGDRVLRDGEGYFRFIDRIKDAIRRRGENISAWEVEQVIESYPAVAAAAVVPVPSELAEDEVMAFVLPRVGASVDPESMIRHCEERIAYFAIPRFIEFVDALPLTETGKVRKYELRARGVQPTTWDRELAGVQLKR
jgi:crotonobetaine/carnitine-CoA ligase